MRGAWFLLFLLTLSGCNLLEQDRCLDQGGAWDAETNSCDTSPVKTDVQKESAKAEQQATADAPSAATTACADSEPAIFSCKIRDGREINVCVASDEQGREYAQYRFGQADEAPELAWPIEYAERSMDWASVPYSGGGEAQLSFARGDVRYVIYSRVIRTNFAPGEPNNPKFEDGAEVYREGRRISSLPCAGEADTPVSVPMAERFGRRQDDLFTD